MVLIILIIIFLFYKSFFIIREPEGFQQQEKYKVQYNQHIYQDPFYVEKYDEINQSKKRLRIEVLTIVETTDADEENSMFLDIGSGTGYAVKELNDLGFQAVGVDQSQAMVSYSEKQYPAAEYQCGNVLETMLFEKDAFTHVLCLYYTIYQFPDKAVFFRNCYHWLQPGGYLIVHLVDPDHFDMAVPSSKHILFGSPKIVGDERNKDSIVDFTNYQYKSSWKKNRSKQQEFVRTETFRNNSNHHILENEQTLTMEKIPDILSSAVHSGFTVKSVVNLKSSMLDEKQYLYFFERML
jgi:SAM-dependent methyltransferase